MTKNTILTRFSASFLAGLIFLLPLAAIAQTRITVPKNKNPISKDIELGNKTAQQVDKQYPILNDAIATRYVQSVGNKIVRAVPAEFSHSEFDCEFKLVNTSDINAFALPGCHLYVNRGLIKAAKNEGEMVGVMAHEISHAMLRHGTAEQGNAGSKILGGASVLGGILGSIITGSEVPLQIGMLGNQAIMSPYSRDFEKNADLLGARIMANGGYDPRDLANMFKTIAAEGNRAPEWLSTHPDPGNRFNYINQEATLLRVSSNPIHDTRDFQSIKRRLDEMPPAKSMAEIEKEGQQNPTSGGATGGNYSTKVALPATSYQTKNIVNYIRVSVPSNWDEYGTETSVTYSPSGAIGDKGFTHGAMIGVYKTDKTDLSAATDEFSQALFSGDNNYLRQQGNFTRGTLASRTALAANFSGTSPITNRTENTTLYTAKLRDGNLLYVLTVVPQNEATNYDRAFRTMLRSIQVND